MKKILVAVCAIVPVFAGFFPSTVTTSVASVNGNTITLNKPFPVNGMSGIVIHTLGKNRKAITAIAIQESVSKVKITKGDLLADDSLPTSRSIVSVGDKVIGGYLYSNVLVLAPNVDTYMKVTKSANKNWIHPDIYAAFLAREGDSTPTPSNLNKFAKEAQVGLVYIVKRGKAVLFDPISKRVIAQKDFSAVGNETKYPFYMRFTHIRGGLFSSKATGDYYKSVGAIH